METEKFKVSIHFLLIFRQYRDVLFFLCARRLCGYTATVIDFFSSMFTFWHPSPVVSKLKFVRVKQKVKRKVKSMVSY